MSYEFLRTAVHDGVLNVLIDRPAKRNALSQAVLGELGACFRAHAADADLVAATITGAGERCFAAGGDLQEFDGLRARDATVEMGRHSQTSLDAIRDFPVPVIALMNGDAIGGGAELAVACDLRVFASHSRIAFVQGTLCISPAWGGGADLVRLVGGGRALRLLARAEFLDARQAFEFGLADAVAPSGQAFADFVDSFMSPIKARRPHVMRAFKSIVLAARRSPEAQRVRDIESELLVSTWLHPDHWAAHDVVLARISGEGR
ncbi:MAG: enoyl-CoA hydratase/isomerase family protein [Gammaproteobacteria bacterium]